MTLSNHFTFFDAFWCFFTILGKNTHTQELAASLAG